MIYQRTIASKTKIVGRGIHSGKKVTLKLYPADADTGIVFLRNDLKNAKPLVAKAVNVGATANNTTLGSGENCVHTIEHLVSALYGLGVDNIRIEIDGPEVPIMDGSSVSFVFLLKEIGIRNLNKSKKFLIIKEPVLVEHEDKWAKIEPSDKLSIHSTIVFAHPAVKEQIKNFEFNCESYVNEIARARTFGFMKDVDYLKKRGLAKGASLENAIGLDDFKVVNPEGLRFKDEFVRHKILDTIGDMALLGHELIGKISTYKSGHHIHNLLCRKILETPSSYEICGAQEMSEVSKQVYQLPSDILVPV